VAQVTDVSREATLELIARGGLRVPEMVVIPPGTFRMGDIQGGGAEDEQPVREVRIAKPFGIGRHEVTFEEYDQFASATGRALPDDQGWGRGRLPVINVSWQDAVAYTAWLSTETGERYRLPTEAEWEYAARAGTDTKYWWGNDIRQDGEVWANCYGCGSQWDNEQTAPVGSFKPNDFGVYDTAGNVYEWVQDCWHDSYEGGPDDGSAWEAAEGGNCDRRVIRGGSWFDVPGSLRSATRLWGSPDSRYGGLGFRLAQDIE
jgi:formylglycine-generating enzyme required for sulfatase activity